MSISNYKNIKQKQDDADRLFEKLSPLKIKTDYGYNLAKVRSELYRSVLHEPRLISGWIFAMVFAMFHGYSKDFVFIDEIEDTVKDKQRGCDQTHKVGLNVNIFFNHSPKKTYIFGRHMSYGIFSAACSPSIYSNEIIESREKAVLFAYDHMLKYIHESCQRNMFYRGRAKKVIDQSIKDLQLWKDCELKTQGELFEWALFK